MEDRQFLCCQGKFITLKNFIQLKICEINLKYYQHKILGCEKYFVPLVECSVVFYNYEALKDFDDLAKVCKYIKMILQSIQVISSFLCNKIVCKNKFYSILILLSKINSSCYFIDFELGIFIFTNRKLRNIFLIIRKILITLGSNLLSSHQLPYQ